MTGGIPAYDIAERAARLHINPDERRILFLLEAKEIDETVMEILKSLFPAQTKDIPRTGHGTYGSGPPAVRSGESEKDSRRIARMIVDTLNTEALVQIRLSYSFMFESLTDLPEAFRETSLALRVGRLFYSEQTVFPYNELGIGRLIYQLPVSLCESFLKEIFGGGLSGVF